MGNELRIEDEELVRLAEELAGLRGMSVPDEVAEAVRERLAREREVQAKMERMRAAAWAFQATLAPPYPSSNHDWLYDENGLSA